MEQTKKGIQVSYPAGTVIIASDRQYKVSENGEWRRLRKSEEVATKFKWPEKSFHLDGKSFTDGFCWCFSCIKEFHPKYQET